MPKSEASRAFTDELEIILAELDGAVVELDDEEGLFQETEFAVSIARAALQTAIESESRESESVPLTA